MKTSDNASTGLDLDAIRDHLVKWDACHVVEQMRNGDGYADLFAEDVRALLAEVERLQAAVVDRERLRDGIRHHRDEHHRLDSEPNHIDRELDRGGADLTLWALLDDRTETT